MRSLYNAIFDRVTVIYYKYIKNRDIEIVVGN